MSATSCSACRAPTTCSTRSCPTPIARPSPSGWGPRRIACTRRGPTPGTSTSTRRTTTGSTPRAWALPAWRCKARTRAPATGSRARGMISMLRFTAGRFQDGLAETAARRWLSAGARSHLLPDMYYEAFEFLSYDPAVAPVDASTLPLDTWLPDLQAAVLHSSWDQGDL